MQRWAGKAMADTVAAIMAELNILGGYEGSWGRRRPRAEETVPRFDRECFSKKVVGRW